MDKKTSKYFYTARLMNQALLQLLEKKDIDYLTVSEITKKAGVNRSTFYLHYDNVYELLEETIENLNKEFVSSFEKIPREINTKEEAFLLTDEILTSYLNFVKTNKRVLKLISQKPQLFQAQKTYQKMHEKIFYPAISQYESKESERVYKLEFFTKGVAAIVHKWLELNCKTEIPELIGIIRQCVNHKQQEKQI